MRVLMSEAKTGRPDALPEQALKAGSQVALLFEGSGKVLALYKRKNGRWSSKPLEGDKPAAFLVVLYEGQVNEAGVDREIVTPEDWAWVEETYGVTKATLGIGVI